MFGTTDTISVAYRDLKEPSAFYGTDHQYELTGLIFTWCAIAIYAWMSAATDGQPEDYYVGGVGLSRAIADFDRVARDARVCCRYPACDAAFVTASLIRAFAFFVTGSMNRCWRPSRSGGSRRNAR